MTAQPEGDTPDTIAGFTKEQLQAFVERIERLEEEKQGISEDIKMVFAEAKGNGFDVKALKAILKLRKENEDARKELDAIVELYAQALGIFI